MSAAIAFPSVSLPRPSRALALANRGYVMESGIITMTGPGKELLSDPKVREAYLGE